jgi:hypothetical protein
MLRDQNSDTFGGEETDMQEEAPEDRCFPFDIDALSKGDIIEPEQLAEFFGVQPRTYEYSLKFTALQSNVRRELRRRGKRWSVVMRGQALVILNDADASKHNIKRFTKRIRSAKRHHEQLTAVDIGMLSDDQRRKHDRAMCLQGLKVAALAHARADIEPPVHRRKTPVFPGLTG